MAIDYSPDEHNLHDDHPSHSSFWFILGTAVGGTAMYLLSGQILRDLSAKTQKLKTESLNIFKEGQKNDHIIETRVRALCTKKLSRPADVRVRVKDGVVNLSGKIQENEVENILQSVRNILGVKDVINHLDVS